MQKQRDRILRHMRDFGGISSLEAITEYGIMRLASRISEMRMEGLPIRSEMVRSKNRYGESVCYKRYYLEEK